MPPRSPTTRWRTARRSTSGPVQLEVLGIKLPGHTPGTTCLLVPGHALLSGDTVFVRGVGRPDLTGKAEELARELFHTVHEKLRPLDPATQVLPGPLVQRRRDGRRRPGPHDDGARSSSRR